MPTAAAISRVVVTAYPRSQKSAAAVSNSRSEVGRLTTIGVSSPMQDHRIMRQPIRPGDTGSPCSRRRLRDADEHWLHYGTQFIRVPAFFDLAGEVEVLVSGGAAFGGSRSVRCVPDFAKPCFVRKVTAIAMASFETHAARGRSRTRTASSVITRRTFAPIASETGD